MGGSWDVSSWQAGPWKVVKKGMDGRRQMCFRRFSVVLLEKAAGGRGTHTEAKGSVTNSGS